jgi:hypothetical protein
LAWAPGCFVVADNSSGNSQSFLLVLAEARTGLYAAPKEPDGHPKGFVMPRTTMFCLGLIAIAIHSGCKARNGVPSASRMQGAAAPDFELTALDGKKVRLSDFRGRPVIVSFFGYG